MFLGKSMPNSEVAWRHILEKTKNFMFDFEV